jgi:hypothetical protein
LSSRLFPADFQIALKGLIAVHHSIYATIPPQGIYFESLVETAFRATKRPFSIVEGTARNAATHDLLVDDQRLSLKTETGKSTKARTITITKLCTTEKEPWSPEILVERALAHLGRYDVILMLRAIWEPRVVHYQLLLIDVGWLQRMESAVFVVVGKRPGRQSFGAEVVDADGNGLFNVHFDASDGKCAIRNLRVSDCQMLSEWDILVPD